MIEFRDIPSTFPVSSKPEAPGVKAAAVWKSITPLGSRANWIRIGSQWNISWQANWETMGNPNFLFVDGKAYKSIHT